MFELFSDISFGLPGPLRTAFELKIALPTATNQAHATALTTFFINLLQRPKTSKYLFESFPKNQNFKNGKSGELFCKNIENGTKMITSCSIRRVARR